MPLNSERDGIGPRIVLVHGFTQNARCWGDEASELALDHEVVRVDAPGHGRSAERYADLEQTAPLLAEVGGVATYLGYSMGARLCLGLALARPSEVRGLVLIGGTAGIDDPDERAQRARRDRANAARIRTDGLERFLDAWLDQPLFRSLPADRTFRAERMTNTVEGLVSSLELAGTGSQRPSWDDLGGLDMPVLLVAGALDEKFSALAERMARSIGDNATLALIPDAGHAAHLEQPDAFLARLRRWLTDHDL